MLFKCLPSFMLWKKIFHLYVFLFSVASTIFFSLVDRVIRFKEGRRGELQVVFFWKLQAKWTINGWVWLRKPSPDWDAVPKPSWGFGTGPNKSHSVLWLSRPSSFEIEVST